MSTDLFDLKNFVETKTTQAQAILAMACDQLEKPIAKRMPDDTNALWAIEDLLQQIQDSMDGFHEDQKKAAIAKPTD